MKTVSRNAWGMPPIGANHSTRPLSAIDEFNVHYSDSPPPDKHSACAGIVLGFDHYHRGKGWACIGYTGVICPHGYLFRGRPWTVVPAAAENHNSHIVAFCLIANGAATREQMDALKQAHAQAEHRVRRRLKVTTHREVEPAGYTTCPGDAIEKQVREWRKTLDG